MLGYTTTTLTAELEAAFTTGLATHLMVLEPRITITVSGRREGSVFVSYSVDAEGDNEAADIESYANSTADDPSAIQEALLKAGLADLSGLTVTDVCGPTAAPTTVAPNSAIDDLNLLPTVALELSRLYSTP